MATAIILAAQAIRLPGKGDPLYLQAYTKAPSARFNWRLLLRSPVFILLWLMLGLSAGIGHMFIGQLVQVGG